MKTFLLAGLLLGIRSFGFGQAPVANPQTVNAMMDNLHDALTSNNNIGYRMPDTRYEGLGGTPYFIPTWAEAQITTTAGVQMSRISLKYNVFSQHLLLRRPMQGDSIELFPEQIDQFVLYDTSGQVWQFRRLTVAQTRDANITDGFFIVLCSGKTSLLKRIEKSFQKANYQGAYSPNQRQDLFLDKATYYLLRPDRKLVRIKKSIQSLLNALATHRPAIESFMETAKNRGRTDVDLAKIVRFFNSLN